MSRRMGVDIRAAVCEFFVTALFLYSGLGTAVLTGDLVMTSLVFGFAVSVLIYVAQHSGAGQMNPAVSLALSVTGYIPYSQAVVNILAQSVAAVVACALLRLSIPRDDMDGNLAANGLKGRFSWENALAAEIVCTFTLQLVIFETLLHPRNRAGKLGALAVGLTVFFVHGILAPIDNCSINPARSFGPAVIVNRWDDFWIFIVGPILGAMLAVPVHIVFLTDWGQLTTGKTSQLDQPTGSI